MPCAPETEAGERYLGVYFKGKLDRFDEEEGEDLAGQSELFED